MAEQLVNPASAAQLQPRNQEPTHLGGASWEDLGGTTMNSVPNSATVNAAGGTKTDTSIPRSVPAEPTHLTGLTSEDDDATEVEIEFGDEMSETSDVDDLDKALDEFDDLPKTKIDVTEEEDDEKDKLDEEDDEKDKLDEESEDEKDKLDEEDDEKDKLDEESEDENYYQMSALKEEGDTKYQEYFRAQLKKHGYESPADIPADKKDDFFNAVDAGYSAKNEGWKNLHEERMLTESRAWNDVTDFCKYISLYVTGVTLTVILFLAWLFTATVLAPIIAVVKYIGFLPSATRAALGDIQRAYKIYQTEKELTPQEIEKLKDAAQRVYNSFGGRTKSFITRSSNQLSRIDLSTPQGKQKAAEIALELKDVIKQGETKLQQDKLDEESEDEKDKLDEEDDEKDKLDEEDDEKDKLTESLKIRVKMPKTSLFESAGFNAKQQKKVAAVFESAIKQTTKRVGAQIHEHYRALHRRKLAEAQNKLASRLNDYLQVVVEEWFNANRVAVRQSLRADLAENFLNGLQTLFKEHYIDVPESKIDVVKTLTTEVKELRAQVNEQVAQKMKLRKLAEAANKKRIVAEFARTLSEAQSAKLEKLAEDTAYVSAKDFREKLTMLKESYFGETRPSSVTRLPEENVQVVKETRGAKSEVDVVADAISRQVKSNW